MPEKRVRRRLHRAAYIGFTLLLLLFVAVAWSVYGGGSYAPLAIGVVTFVLLIYGLFLVSMIRAERRDKAKNPPSDLREWARGEFDAHTGKLPANEALLEMLLPGLAVALGFLALSLVFAAIS